MPVAVARSTVRNKVVNRKRLVLWIVALLLASAALAGWLYVSHPPGVDYTQFTKIKRGMAMDEVDRLMGGESKCVRTEDSQDPAFVWGDHLSPDVETGAEVSVWFDDQDRVLRKEFLPAPNSFLEWLKDGLYDVGLGKLADLVF
jgi:hypothetical protein